MSPVWEGQGSSVDSGKDLPPPKLGEVEERREASPCGANRTQLTTPVCWLNVAKNSTLGSCSFEREEEASLPGC